MSDDIKIVKMQSGRIGVECPKNEAFIEGAHNFASKWQPPYWLFDPRDEPAVRALLIEVYGRDDKAPTALVDVEINLDEWGRNHDQTYTFAGLRIAHRPGRDDRVRLGGGAVVKTGGFPTSGGSVKNPGLYPDAGTVLIVRDVPGGHADLADKGVTVVSTLVDRPALEAERAGLMARVAEIDQLLEG